MPTYNNWKIMRPKEKPRKMWKGKKRIALKGTSKWMRTVYKWLLNAKPGDYVATCEGCNRKIAKIEYEVIQYGKHRVLNGGGITDTHGRWHSCPGSGCALPPETREQLAAYQDAMNADEAFCKEWGFVKREIDEFGEYIDKLEVKNND